MADIRIEPYQSARHQRAGFDCGKPALNEFLRTLVSQYERRRLGRTFVAVRPGEPDTVVGYYTLAAGSIAVQHLPREAAAKLPRHPAPAILLGRLAVDQRAQGQGLGRGLLVDALRRALELSASLEVFAVVVMAIDQGAAGFYAKYGFRQLLDAPLYMYTARGSGCPLFGFVV
ncbi:MAG: GNAT family N-acetyltransferase [Thermoguttaceae bacterium]